MQILNLVFGLIEASPMTLSNMATSIRGDALIGPVARTEHHWVCDTTKSFRAARLTLNDLLFFSSTLWVIAQFIYLFFLFISESDDMFPSTKIEYSLIFTRGDLFLRIRQAGAQVICMCLDNLCSQSLYLQRLRKFTMMR